jgi:predicted esterase
LKTFTIGGTVVEVTEPLPAGVPLVVLLHGLGGNALHMTDPSSSPDLMPVIRNLNAPVGGATDRGIQFVPGIGAAGFEIDPTMTVRGWRGALNAAGFPTLSYTQVSPGGTLAPNLMQLQTIAAAVLEDPDIKPLPLVFLGHSRGGVLARQFLVGAAANPSFMSRVRACITLHAPHTGSALANAAVSVDGALAGLQTTFTGMGLPAASALLGMARTVVGSPAFPELAVGGATLASIAASEPVAGVEYHTFGGTSTHFARLRAHAFTPESALPIPIPLLPFPLFHWTTVPVQVGIPVDPLSFVPIVPTVIELQLLLSALTAMAPELQHGSGDLLVADARAHLPFSLTRTTNPLTHAEALYDLALQGQVVGILQRFRPPVVTGRASVRISPFPARQVLAQHTVFAEDATTGAPVAGTVVVRDPFGAVAFQGPVGTAFSFSFAPRKVRTFDPETHHWDTTTIPPTAEADLVPPYPDMDVDLGLVGP